MSGVYDVFEDRYIDASEIDQKAPPERYKAITKDLLIEKLQKELEAKK